MSKESIRKVLGELDERAEQAWQEQDAWLAAHPGEDRPVICEGIGVVGRCTDTSVWLAEKLGGEVRGYQHKNNPGAELGALEFGHDFVVVDGRWLVDWWAKDTYGEKDLYDLKNPIDRKTVAKLYGDPRKWETLSKRELEAWKASQGL